MDLNLGSLIDRIWEDLNLVKVYTKKRGAHPDLTDPICMRKGATIEDVCNGIHRSLAANFRYALVWYVLSHWSGATGFHYPVLQGEIKQICTACPKSQLKSSGAR